MSNECIKLSKTMIVINFLYTLFCVLVISTKSEISSPLIYLIFGYFILNAVYYSKITKYHRLTRKNKTDETIEVLTGIAQNQVSDNAPQLKIIAEQAIERYQFQQITGCYIDSKELRNLYFTLKNDRPRTSVRRIKFLGRFLKFDKGIFQGLDYSELIGVASFFIILTLFSITSISIAKAFAIVPISIVAILCALLTFVYFSFSGIKNYIGRSFWF